MLMLEKEWKMRQTPFHDCRCLCYNSNTTNCYQGTVVLPQRKMQSSHFLSYIWDLESLS